MALFQRTSGPGKHSFMARLRSDVSGNVFAMTAAAVFPMVGVVGGAIDASRTYMTRARLQAACDSAVLAGRKAMATKVYDTAAQTRADAMFNFNFQDADFQTAGTNFDAEADANGKLEASAATSVPMTLMRMFGFSKTEISVNCSADVQIPNIDIVFVLDVTGSMGFELDDETRMDALHRAAKGFYSTLATQMAAAGANGGRIRYGFVPFSQAVNGRDLFQSSPNTGGDRGELPLSHLASSMSVESREANFVNVAGSAAWKSDPDSGITTYRQEYDHSDNDTIQPFEQDTDDGTKMSNADCENYGNNKSFAIAGGTVRYVHLFPQTAWPGGEGRGSSTLYYVDGSSTHQTTEPTSGNYFWRITFSRRSSDWEDGEKTNKFKVCERNVHWEKFVKNIPEFRFKNWTYRTVTYDSSVFRANTAIRYARPWFDADRDGRKDSNEIDDNRDFDDYLAPDAGPYSPVELAATPNSGNLNFETFQWNGCLEERETTAATSFAPIPAAAFDLNWLAGGTTTQTRWRPIMDKVTYNRGQSGNVTTTQTVGPASQACPTARMQNLQEWTQTGFDDYIDSLQPLGGTYLDIGLIWGLRLIAPQGMFAARNLTGPNGGQISRHVIFLTDGEMSPADSSVSAYGLESVSKRITNGTNTSAKTLHLRRFQALCDGQRGAIALWAIGFATEVEGALTDCADPGRAFQADDADDLEHAFTSIARDIADLRLVE